MKNIILLFALLYFATPGFGQMCDQIVIEGKSSLKIAPEQFIFNLTITASDMNYTTCADMALEKAEEITKKFIKNGIDRDLIRTRNYSIREIREHDYKTNKREFKGYRAAIPITIKTLADYNKNDKIFEIIKNNFNADFNLNFALTPEQKDVAKDKLIAMAVEDAIQKAMVVTKSAGLELGEISKIQYGEPQTIRAFSNVNYDLQQEKLMIRGASALSGSSAVLNPSEVEMKTNILISWRIKE